MDAGNVLKPYLARGALRCIGATTFRDYNRTIKKDGALSRRFHKIVVHEVDRASTLDILKGLKSDFEAFHGCSISDDILEQIVDFSARYLTERRFPDKAIDCLDDACARASMKNEGVEAVHVESTVASLANVPVSMLRSTDADRLVDARPVLKDMILGNDDAIDEVCNILMSSLAGGKRKDGVLCSMIVHGPSGVGKKTMLKELSRILFGGGATMSINGAEYVEPHSISKIIGSPPGYVGYNEESQIVRQIRRCPHSFILVDGIGKMNISVREQMFDMLRSGRLTTGEGDDIDLGNAVFVFVEDSGLSHTVGFSADLSNSSRDGLDRWTSYGIFGDVDGVVRFRSVDSPEIFDRIARMEAEESGVEDGAMGDVEKMIEKILEENRDVSPSKIRREIRRGLKRMDAEEMESVDSIVDVVVL